MISMSIADEFRGSIEQSGLTPPDTIIADGRIHRFPTNSRRDDDSGWYVFWADQIPAGMFGDWRSDLKQTWRPKSDRAMTAAERAQYKARMEAAKKQRDEEERRRHADAAFRADALWQHADPAPDDHPYLSRKHIKAHGLRVTDRDNCLVVPVFTKDRLASLQFISPDGSKKFLSGGAVAGGYYVINDETTTFTTALVCEGFATAASLYEATKIPAVIAFSASNLLAVTQDLRATYSDTTIIICGDHDKSGAGGERSAKEAAEAVDARIIIPTEEGHDWNDVHTKQGLDAVRAAVAARMLQPTPCVLDEVYAFLGRFVAYPSESAHVAHTLWTAHTHLMDSCESTPRIAFLSPEPGSGKTRALEITETLVPRPVEAINTTPAYLFRKVSDPAGLPTILYDEIDTIFGPRAKEHEEIRGIINAGHGAGLWRDAAS